MQKTKKILGIITLMLSMLFFGLGVSFPLLSTKTRALWVNWTYETVNLFDSIKLFFENGEYLLAGVILVFSFLLPVVGYVGLIIRLFTNKTVGTLQHLDKWNMLDVFLVALLVLNFQMNSNFIVMELRIGTTFIALAVIFRILTIVLITKNNIKARPAKL